VKAKVKQFVKEGRLEILNGGWSANDEACPIFEDIIDNMMFGHQYIKRELGVEPRVGWLVDSFGHSATNARLYADMGLEALFISRIATGDRDKRIKDSALNYLWRPDTTHFGDQHELLVSYFTNTYCFPEGFAFDTIADEDDPF
jgi:alpha-mannosidase